jgi:hypothetical protein
MPDLIWHPVDVRLRGEQSLFSPWTWAGWIPDQVRYDGSDGLQNETTKELATPMFLSLRESEAV